VVTVVCALPLLVLGAEVTTKQVGMVDPVPLRSPTYLGEVVHEHGGFTNAMNELGLGGFIEHWHRTVGWFVGLLAIGLAVLMWRFEKRRWLRWAALAALLAVSAQGILGILRVYLDRRVNPDAGLTMALIHGCTAQLVFAFLVAIALWTSAGWQKLGLDDAADYQPLRRLSLLLVAVMYLQIVFGGIMRHKELALGTRMHIWLAFAVVGLAVWLGVRVLQAAPPGGMGRRGVFVLWGLLSLQLLLGLESFFSKFLVEWRNPRKPFEQLAIDPDLIRSLHFLVGAMTFATAVSLVLIAHRHVAWATRSVAAPGRQLEGVL
jgi:cytochrome c oxidase assembly protein subunit 15